MKSATKQPRRGKAPHGGARPGSGRKKKAVILAGPIERIKSDIETLAPLVGPALRELVEGIYIEETSAKGVRRVYQQPPNLGAIETVINRTLGKLTDKLELQGTVTTEVVVAAGTPRKPAVE